MKEIGIAIILIILMLLLLNPLHFFMPSMMLTGLLLASILVFALFAVFILQEKVVDERENAHRMLSGRVAYLTGSTLLTVGIIFQSLSHAVDPWLFATLVIMIVSKIGVRIYTDWNF